MANATAPNRQKDDPTPGRGGTPCGLVPVLVLTGLNSLGTGAVQTGVFFLLQIAYGYGTRENLLYGVCMYAAYVGGALSIGPMLRRRTGPDRVPRRGIFAKMSTRRVLVSLVLAQAMLSLLPQIAAWATGARTPGVWTMWAVGIGFGVLSGMMWPIIESYLSGGRTGRSLSGATGKFNIVWSSSVVAAFWLMAPLLESRPILVITALAFVQAASAGCAVWLPREPARHLIARHEPHPASWHDLLRWFRVLLPLGYVLSGTLSPLLPSVIDRLGVERGWMTPVASAWVMSRVVVFVVFERWHAWHGRRWMPLVAGGCLLGGFAAAVLVPPSAGLVVLIASLGVFGVGHAVAYVGALFYAMELGDAEVDAGGTHEALIGIGYGTGPVLGLGAIMLAGSAEGAAFDGWLIGLVFATSVLAMVMLGRKKRA